jgi:hypothetical protein
MADITHADEYPGRQDSRYQDVPYIETEALHDRFLNGEMLIVDVRSELEYETIHIEVRGRIILLWPTVHLKRNFVFLRKMFRRDSYQLLLQWHNLSEIV